MGYMRLTGRRPSTKDASRCDLGFTTGKEVREGVNLGFGRLFLAFGVIALGIITAIQLILLEFIGFQRTLGKSLQQKSVRLPSEWLKEYPKDHGTRSARRYVRLKSTLRARRTHISDLRVANRGKVQRGTQILGDVSDHLGNLRLRHVIGGVEEIKSLQKSLHHHFSCHDKYCSDKPVSESKEFKFSSSGQRLKSMAFVAVMPRPGQPGALLFEGKKVTDFLSDWSMECDEYGLSDQQKCRKLPKYCSKEIGTSIEKLKGYVESDWALFQTELKTLFRDNDPPKDTQAALTRLIKEAKAGKVMSVEMYVLNYTAITDVLAKKGMSKFDRYIRLLEGLPEAVKTKVFNHGTKKGWRMFEYDAETLEPEFEEVKKVVLEKAKMWKKKKLFDSGSFEGFEGDTESESGGSSVVTPTASTPASSVPTAASSPAPAVTADPIGELTKQIAKLALSIEGQPRQQLNAPAINSGFMGSQPAGVQQIGSMGSQPVGVQQTGSTGAQQTSGQQRFLTPREPRCMYCDSLEHTQYKWRCDHYKEALDANIVGFNTKGRLMLMATGEEIPLRFGRGGMKSWVEERLASIKNTANVATATVGAITYNDGCYGRLGGDVKVMVLDPEDGWVEVDCEDKRKRDGLPVGSNRRVKPRLGPGSPSQGASRAPPPVRVEEVPDEDMPDAVDGTQSAQGSQEEPMTPAANKQPKFRLASELNQTITTEDVGRKVMDAPIQLKMSELLAVSSDVAGYIHDQTRRRRIPIDAAVSSILMDANAGSVAAETPLYACASGRAKCRLNEDIEVEAALDDGSELNVMNEGLWKRLGHPIDTEIDWTINGYDSNAEQEVKDLKKKGNLIGVCHNVKVDIGGVEVKQHIFVVYRLGCAELTLGRPWERMVRAHKDNMDDGSYRYTIRSPDGRRIVEFSAVPAQHERNREYVRMGTKPNVRSVAGDLKARGVGC